MKNLDELLSEYETYGDGMDAYEQQNMDALLMQKGVNPADFRGRLVRSSNAQIHPNQSKGGDKAQFDIVISRATVTIAQNLECMVFGSQHLDGGYGNGMVNPASGGSLVVTGGIWNTLPTTVRFAHTVGANTDNINITCNQVNYPSFLKAGLNCIYRISNIRYTVSDTTANGLLQFSVPFEVRTKSLFGKADQNPISVASFKKPENFQAGIIDIPTEIWLDGETGIAVSMTNAVAQTVTLSVFVERFNKQDRYDLTRYPKR